MVETASALKRSGCDVQVVVGSPGPLLELLQDADVPVTVASFPVLKKDFRSILGVFSLAIMSLRSVRPTYKMLRKANPDLVILNTITVPIWALVARSLGIKSICHVHEAESHEGRITRILLYLPLVTCSWVILNSEAARRAACSTVPRLSRKSTVVLNGIHDTGAVPRRTDGCEVMRIGVVARLSPRKATLDAIKTLTALRSTGQPAELHLFGDHAAEYEWYLDALNQEIRSHALHECVIYHGYVTPPSACFEEIDILLAPSLVESYGNTVVEAQLGGRPVVASRAEGHLETIEHGVTGLLVDIGDIADYAEQCLRLHDDVKLHDGIVGRARLAAQIRNSVENYDIRILSVVNFLFANERS